MRVTKAHTRSYDDPIMLRAGDVVQVTKRDMFDGAYLWLWCLGGDGKEGWVPAAFLDVDADEKAARARRDYSALELTVAEGEVVTVVECESGWCWVKNARGDAGWVPASTLA